jgi:predicted GNAT superfamily acetyltransferase
VTLDPVIVDVVGVTVADVAEGAALRDTLVDLNNAHAVELSWLEPDRFDRLVGEAFAAMRIGDGEALLLAFDRDADYDSPNFLWFRSRFDRFVYVDRVVVGPRARGRGHARRLYRALFDRALRAGHERIVCEVNSDPPNPESDAFHAALGFVPVGEAAIHGGAKTVRYLVRDLVAEDRAVASPASAVSGVA